MKNNIVAITSTVPSEIIWAAGYRPLDLNNVFVNHPDQEHLVNIAEFDGFPLNCCAWIKGIYGVCKTMKIENVLCVTNGDCSNTLMLMEVLKLKGFRVWQFAYPPEPDIKQMQQCLEQLADKLGTPLDAAERIRDRFVPIRNGLAELDHSTWSGGLVSGFENHLWLVTASDFNGDFKQYQQKLLQFTGEYGKRAESQQEIRLAYIGVPPVFAADLYGFIEKCGARVVFNEIQRQFAMLNPAKTLAEQYTRYTYPFCIQGRVDDILEQGEKRRIDGVIHYVQAFCHRGIADIIFRHKTGWPVLTLEGNNEFICNQHVRTRVEAFIDMLRRARKHPGKAAGALAK